MRCTQCAAVTFSAAARTLIAQGERCPQCGGEMALAPEEPPIAVGAESEGASGESARRFER